MRIKTLSALLLSVSCVIVTAASCAEEPTAPTEGSERADEPSELRCAGPVEVDDDDGDPFGGDPDVGSGIGAGPSSGGSEPSSGVWGPVSSTPAFPTEPDPDEDPDTSGNIGIDPGYQYTPGNPGHPVSRPGKPASSPGREPPKPCDAKCEQDYEDAAAGCGRMHSAAARTACQDRAYRSYQECGKDCQGSKGDCHELCKEKCDRDLDRCSEVCKKKPKKDRPLCHHGCMKKYSRDLKECSDRCK